MFKTIILFLVVATVVYGRPSFSDENVVKFKKDVFESQVFDDLVDEIAQQVIINSSETRSEKKVCNSNNCAPHSGTRIDKEAVRISIFNSDYFNDWIQQIWQQVTSQYESICQSSPSQIQGPVPSQPDFTETKVESVHTSSQPQFTTQIKDVTTENAHVIN